MKKYYGAFALVAVVLGLLFELRPVFLLVLVLGYCLCVPSAIRNQKKFVYETKRFHDVNSYMSQMAQSFIYTHDVIQSLEETATCFSSGRMHETLVEAFERLEDGKWDIKRAERDALFLIESRYDCEKLRNLHSFLRKAEELGGECHKEFQIIEHMRIAWQGVVEGMRVRRLWERNVGVLIYMFFLFVCVIMLHIMRGAELDIMSLLATQIVSTLLLAGLVLYFLFMDKRIGGSLLIKPVVMSEEHANAYFEYLETYDAKREQRKYLSFGLCSLAVAALLVYCSPGWVTLAIALGLVVVGFHVHTLIHANAVRNMRAEVAKAFPKWLFDVILLLQRESVEGAMEKSIETAPPVLKRELHRVTELLAVKPHAPEAYMSFLEGLGNPGTGEIMHKLYSLAVGANRDSEVLDVVMEKNIRNLEKAERDSMMLKDSMESATWVPFLCVGFGCMGYLVIAIITSINGIINLI